MSEPAVDALRDVDNPYALPPAHTTFDTEYAAATQGALAISRTARGRMRMLGERARETLTGLVTNDVLGLDVGAGLYAAALNAKGKLIADLRVYALRDGLWIDVAPLAWPGWWATVRKYVNPRLAKYEDLSTLFATVSVHGPAAAEAIAHAGDVDRQSLAELPPYAHVPLGTPFPDGIVARQPNAPGATYDVWVRAGDHGAMEERLRAAGVVTGGGVVAHVLRVESGRPEYGIDMDEGTLAQEANMDDLHAISYTKGCYTGQETVARVHFRGHVNRHLRALRVLAGGPLVRGTDLRLTDGTIIGDVRSAAASPSQGVIAIAMLRRDVAPGTTVQCGDSGSAQVVPLPYAQA
ncbi:MAG: hypothetical protein U0163_19065 [Gemmatimonadaceae bacterium]